MNGPFAPTYLGFEPDPDHPPVSITAIANIDFTGLKAGYDYLFSIRNAVPAAAAQLQCRMSQGTVFDVGNSYGTQGGNPSSLGNVLTLTNSASVNATLTNGGVSAAILLQNPGSTTEYKTITGNARYSNTTPLIVGLALCGQFLANTNAIDGARIFFNGQNFQAVGSIYVFRQRLS